MADEQPPVLAKRLLAEVAGLLLHSDVPENASERRVVRRIEFFDPGMRTDTRDALMLVCAPAADRYDYARLVDRLLDAAVLVLPPQADVEMLVELLERSSQSARACPLILRKSEWASWADLHTILSRNFRALRRAAGAHPDADSLESLAHVLSTQSGASITVEDLSSRVLAYSNVDGEVDPLRRDTILQRAVPAWRVSELLADGFLQAVWNADDVVERPAKEGQPARMVVPVKSDGAAIGTIWAAYPPSVSTDQLRMLLREAARAAAPLMLRALGRPEHERKLKEEALESILKGSGPLQPAATMLGLPMEQPSVVVAYECMPYVHQPLIDFHLRAVFPGSCALQTGTRRYLLAEAAPHDDADAIAARVAEHFSRVLVEPVTVLAAVGTVAPGLSSVAASAEEAGLVLRALHRVSGCSEHDADVADRRAEIRAATAADVDDSVELLRIADRLRGDSATLMRRIDALEDYDRTHGTELLATLRAVLAGFGNMSSAARTLSIHTNSLRYRIGRIHELVGIDTGDSDSRLRAELALLLRDSTASG